VTPIAASFFEDLGRGFATLPAGQDVAAGWVVGRILLVVLVVHAILILGALMVWLERRVAAWIQDRIGPNRVGPQGLLQPLADLGKFIFKEDVIPAHVNKWMYVLAPVVALVPAMITFAVIPFAGHQWEGEGTWRSMQIADLAGVGVLYILSIASLGVYGITLGGWASNSKYSLLGGVRSSAQMISYELTLGLALVPIVLVAGSLSLADIVEWQRAGGWFVFHQPLAFFLFLVASYAETNRLPFDLPEAETELVAGYHTEYSSMKFALFFLAEYTNMIVSSALVTTCFLGGWTLFGLEKLGWLMALLIFASKMMALLFVYVWVRWTLPRFRYDQLMGIGWNWFIPLALVNLILTAAAEALGHRWLGWLLPVALVGLGVFAAWLAWRRDRARGPSAAGAYGAAAAPYAEGSAR
jgi:NADH-quinone oxidoreductase subunit H